MLSWLWNHFCQKKEYSSLKIFQISQKIFAFFIIILAFSILIHLVFTYQSGDILNLNASLNQNHLSDNIPYLNEFNNLIIYDNGEFNAYAICIIQSFATLIALIASISLIAVQLTASSYSPQIIPILAKRKPEIWLVLLGYIVLFAFTWILTIFGPNIFSVLIIISIGFIGLVGLIPYSAHVMEILTPSHIIKIVIEDIQINPELKEIDELETKFEILVDLILASIKTALRRFKWVS